MLNSDAKRLNIGLSRLNVSHWPRSNSTLFAVSVQSTAKGHNITGHQGPREEVEGSLYLFLSSALEGGGCSAPRPGRFTPGKDPVPIVQEAGWAPGPVRKCAKNLAQTGIRSPGPSFP
jgi:hypothetical protein